MPSNAEVYSMLALILTPCLVTGALIIWHYKSKAKKATDPHFEAYKAALEDWTKGVETRIQEMTEAESTTEVA